MATKKKVSAKVEPSNPESMVCEPEEECEEMTDDEKEVKQLRYLLNEMNSRGIHDLGTLGVILERKERELKSH